MKILTLIAFLIINFSIYAEEAEINKKERKANQIYLRRNNAYAAPNEFNMYNSMFPISLSVDIPSIQYNTFGFARYLGDSKFSIEGNFYEYKKTNFAFDRSSLNTGFFSKGNLGTYYRSEQNLFLNYHLIENRVILNLGLQRLQSDLSDGRFGSYNYNFSQNFTGIVAGFLLESPRIYGIYISVGYRYSILNGNSHINYSVVTSGRNAETFEAKDNPFTKSFINEYKVVLGFELNDSILMSLGFIDQSAKVVQNRSQLMTGDPFSTILVRSALEYTATNEYFSSTFASITYKY
ncbi:LA_2444/LA_4059 family outer membrane protein [Leptospira levettii]|nr:LA_2444/LA_4059 family outer membrane protein [Leptospira levettii]MCW7475613.1 LA_2444/LA_4059 family outer membrane protein [Leptospira levettii]